MLFDEFFDIVSYCLVFVVGCNIKQYCCLIFVAFSYGAMANLRLN